MIDLLAFRCRCRDLVALLLCLLGTGSLLVPAVVRAQMEQQRSHSISNLREIGQAMYAFEAVYGFLPGNGGPPMEAVTTPDCRTVWPDSEAFRWGYGDPKRAGRLQTGGWAYSLLPYVGEEEAFRKQDYSRAVPLFYLGTRRLALPQSTPRDDPVYTGFWYQDAGLGPSGRTDYAANDQVIRGGIGTAMRLTEISDGLATTLLVGEKAMDTRAVKAGVWYWDGPIILGGTGGSGRKGDLLLQDSDQLGARINDNWGSPDPEVVFFLTCDGGLRRFGYSTPKEIMAALISPRGGETVDLDER
jgi:hypothetical protein